MLLPLHHSRYQIILLFAFINIAFFTILRAVFYFSSWSEMENAILHFPVIFATGLIYDVVFNIYFAILFAVLLLFIPNKTYTSSAYRYLTYFFFFLFVYGLYFVLVAEWLFWNEFSARFNFISVDYLVYSREVTSNIYESYPVFWILALAFVAAAVLFKFLQPHLKSILNVEESFKKRLVTTVSIVALALLSNFTLGQTLRDQRANNYEKEIASNGPYQFISAFRNNTIDYKAFYAQGDNELLSKLAKQAVHKENDGGLYDISRAVTTENEEKKYNVILISVESLSAEFLTRFGKKEDVTPFMDEWFKQGLLFTNLYATGTRTARGLEAITLSVPPTPGRSIVKRPGNDNLQSIGEVFKSQGYDTAFMYGGRGYFDNMNTFFSNHGYRIVDQASIDKKEIIFENAWGVSDEVLYDQVIKNAIMASEKHVPFFYHVMTTSNHRPYTYPDGRIDIASGSSRNGAIKYTDYALKHLIDEAKKYDWFDNTVFVVVADHTASSAGKVELPVEKYHIPLFIYAPKIIQAGEIDKLASQIDIAPTVLALLDVAYQSEFWGNDILAENFEPRALIANYQKLGLYEKEKMVVLSPGKKIVEIKKRESGDLVKQVDVNDPLVLRTMAYYQGAEYNFKQTHTE